MREIYPVGNEVRINEVRNDRARGARVDVAVRNQASLLPGREVAMRQRQRGFVIADLCNEATHVSLSLSLTLSFNSSRSHRCSQRHLFSLLVLVTVLLSLVAERQEISQERMEASRATKSNAEKTAGRIGRARQIERNGPGITLRAARAIKLFKTHCRRADVSKLCELPFLPLPFSKKHLDVRFAGDSPLPLTLASNSVQIVRREFS